MFVGLLFVGLGSACGLPPASVLPPVESLHGFAMEARGHTFAGLAAVSVGPRPWQLDVLMPTGNSLFSVQVGDEVQVQAGMPELEEVLARIPFERDLALLYRYRCEGSRCRAGRWRLVAQGEGWSLRGPGGRATLVRQGQLLVLHDPRRGYTMRVHAP